MPLKEHDCLQLVAAKAIIRNAAGKMLVLQQSHEAAVSNAGQWHMPGGIIEPGESVQQGLLREIKEETGLDAAIITFLNTGHWEADIRGEHFNFVGLFYECAANGKTITLDPKEGVAYQWIGLADMEKLVIVEPARTLITRVLNGDSAVTSALPRG